jgi:hypothetical protein|tara:strand:+ start:246 stop:566 length:321 start_codon:yes stop_codon:yes gene_type:complete
MALKWPDKDPDDQLDYSINWSPALGSDTISSVIWKIFDENGTLQTWSNGQTVNGLQLISRTNTTTVATIYLGSGTAFTTYKIVCRMTASDATVREQEVRIRVVEKN